MPPERPDIFTVVLTGGIASGKTAVSSLFADLGVPVIDTDRIAREVVEPGQPALEQIVESFGAEVLDAEGGLDRRKMRALIFSDTERRKDLEGILHPVIREEVMVRIRQLAGSYCILVIPLFTESASYGWVDRVLVVDVPEEVQVRRVMARDGIERADAEAVLSAQSAREDRLALADDVLDNSGSLEELAAKIEALHAEYLALAAR